MNNFANSKKDAFLASIPTASIESHTDTIASRCKFNFSYFHVEPASQEFHHWTHEQLHKLFEKLKDYSRETLTHWQRQRIGAGGTVLSIYGKFPSKSDLCWPKHVPNQARWGRFRLESAVRLVGFVLPDSCNGEEQSNTGYRFDCNTFYVVYLDANHSFYKTEPK